MSLTPLLRWAGGKSFLAPRIKEIYEPHRHRRLVEPFCGGLSIALALQPDRAVLADVNEHLINFYNHIKDCRFEFAGWNDERYYYETRDRLNSSVKYSMQSAQDFYYLNLAGFNGLCRYNSSLKFNVPYGKRKRLAVCDDFIPYKKAMQNWFFNLGDYSTLKIKDGDFLFVDPPYDGSKTSFTSYSGNVFGWQQQTELADWLDRCPKVPQIATNLATDRIIQLYTERGWTIELIDAPRRISCNGDRNSVKEMLATRYL